MQNSQASKNVPESGADTSSTSFASVFLTRLTAGPGKASPDSRKAAGKTFKPMKTPSPPEESENPEKGSKSTTESEGKIPAEGKAYFVCDDTPPMNYFVFMRSFLRRYGFFLTSWTLPEKWAKRIFKVTRLVLWLLGPFLHINPPLSEGDIHQLCRHYTISANLAASQLNYKPIFSNRKSLQRTLNFYDNEYKEAMSDCLFRRALGSQHLSISWRMSKFKREIATIDLGDDIKPRSKSKRGPLLK